jgi:hypothetical protein
MEGFGDTHTYDVNLYSVGRNGKLSEPEKVSITPLTPPVLTTQISMEVAFGGVKLNLSNNPSQAALTVMLLIDTTGKWQLLHTFYTMADQISFVRRELEPKEQTFAVVIRDRWGNISDTLARSVITPYEEIKLDKTTWTNEKLPTDSWEPYANNVPMHQLENIWGGPEAVAKQENYQIFASLATSPMPQHFTISLGYKASISRMKLWTREPDLYYTGNMPREFELWGSDNPPLDGSWNNWYMLGKWSVLKPSGYGAGREIGTITAEDQEYYKNKLEFELVYTDDITEPYRPVRFIRFKTLSTFSTYGTDITEAAIVLGEMALWGTLIND